MRVFGFIRGKIQLYLPLESIRGVYPEETVFCYPELYDRFLGLVFLSGEIIPVVDIYKILSRSSDTEHNLQSKGRYPLILVESANSLLAFVYDSIKDIYDREKLENVPVLDSINLEENISKGVFFVENIKLIEDIIHCARIDKNNLQEIFLCPKES